MSQNRKRRLAMDLIPCVLLIGYGVIEPMMSLVVVPPGVVLLIWAGFRFWRTAK